MFKKAFGIFLGFGILLSFPCFSYPVPSLTGPVFDQVGLLSRSDYQQLDELLRQANSKGVAQVQVVILKDLMGEPIESVSIQFTDKWKLGNARQDNGVLFLVAVQDKKMRIEVGQGLEGTLPDLKSRKILDEVVRPYFRQGEMSSGVVAGVIGILQSVDGEFAKLEGPSKPKKSDFWIFLFYLLIFIIVIFGRLRFGGSAFYGRRSRGIFWGGGGGGWGGGSGSSGGGWSGGGGGFSGGGSSSGW